MKSALLSLFFLGMITAGCAAKGDKCTSCGPKGEKQSCACSKDGSGCKCSKKR